ncbi:hypothetical protein [Clostridium sp. M14]|nr:hypothetical protein [Clostridium sp. M14]MBZ9691343.1 hypothetical protein [Clostridium sp. M14]
MKNKTLYSNNNITNSDPASSKYAKNVDDKSHEESPYGNNEPSPRTTYK